MLPRSIEEQLVLDDWSANRGAVDVLIKKVELVAVFIVTDKAVITEHVKSATGELVGAALGHGVDTTTGKAGLRSIIRRDVDLQLLDSLDRYDLVAGRLTARVQAEFVITGYIVNRQVVVINFRRYPSAYADLRWWLKGV